VNRRASPSDRPLDVWFICNAWTGGGAERVMSTIVQHLDRDIVRPSVCLLRDDMSYPLPQDVATHHLGYRGLPTFMAVAHRLRRLIDDQKPDIIVSTVNANALLTGAALARSSHRPPWIARIGNSPKHHDRGLRGLAAGRLYKGANQIVVNSERLSEEVAAVYPFLRARIVTISNPCDFDYVDQLAGEPPENIERPSGPLLVAAGRLSPAKRYDVMLNALAIVKRNTSATLWVCGEGPLRKSLEKRAEQLGLGDSVRWLGFQTNPFALMRLADVFVLTSDFEGLPNSLIEAQGLGIPAVSTNCPTGPDEIVENDSTGKLVAPGDVEAIANAMLELLTDEETRRRMAAAARARTRSLFEHRKIIDTWQELLVRSSAIHGDTM
jgi:glycosyltransferase involved in cell wall biosynthesis